MLKKSKRKWNKQMVLPISAAAQRVLRRLIGEVEGNGLDDAEDGSVAHCAPRTLQICIRTQHLQQLLLRHQLRPGLGPDLSFWRRGRKG